MSLSDKEFRCSAPDCGLVFDGFYHIPDDGCYRATIGSLRHSLKEAEINLAHEEALGLYSYYEDLREFAAWTDYLDIKALHLSSARKERDDAMATIKELETQVKVWAERAGSAEAHLQMSEDGPTWIELVKKLEQAESTIAQMAEALEAVKVCNCKGVYGFGPAKMHAETCHGTIIGKALALPLVVSILERQRGKKP